MAVGRTLLKATGDRGLRSYQRTIELRVRNGFRNLTTR